MESRIWRCMRTVNPKHQCTHDLIYFKRCVSLPKRSSTQCYRTPFQILTVFNGNRFLYKHEFDARYQNCYYRYQCPCSLQISVHKMFNINLTWVDFTVYDNDDRLVQPVGASCHSVNKKLAITYKNCSYMFCGRRLPWSIFVDYNRVDIKLLRCVAEILNVYIVAKVALIDQQISPGRCEPYVGSLVNWGPYEV